MADLWGMAGSPGISSDDRAAFRRLVAHEYIEAKLMEQGMPYRPDHHDYWNSAKYGPKTAWPTPGLYGAHDAAPREHGIDPFGHYRSLGLPAPVAEMAMDLNNLDVLVEEIWKGRNP